MKLLCAVFCIAAYVSIPSSLLAQGILTQITTDTLYQGFPEIYGNRIVWVDNRGGAANSDIYMYNITTGIETQITTDIDDQSSPAVWGDKIVWTDYRNNDADIYMYDISTGMERSICTANGNQQSPKI